jgi:hypothetical protein
MRVVALSSIFLIAVVSESFAAFDPHRIVTDVDYVSRTVSCHAKPREPSYTYRTTDKTVVRISGKRPRQSRGDFSQIKVGEVITVQYHLDGQHRIAERIVVYPPKK